MNRDGSPEPEVAKLLQVSEQALKAARIEHREAFQSAMQEREILIAQLWELPEDQPLPRFDEKAFVSRGKGKQVIKTGDLRRLRELDQGILLALEAQKKRLEENENQMSRGKRYMRDIRTFASEASGGRLDRKG
jgi:small-conductance mechanosensitive channel